MNKLPSVAAKQRVLLWLLFGLIAATLIGGAGWGYSSLSYDRLVPTLLGNGTFREEFVLFSVRMPRMVVTLLAGMALALAGTILQSVLRNDLADPGLIGINSGAGVGVTAFFLFFPLEAGAFFYALPFAALAGALLAAALIYLFSYDRSAGIQPSNAILVGVGFSTALSGLMILAISSADREKVDFIATWLAGSIWGADWPFIWAILPWLALFIPVAFLKSRSLDLLAFAEPVAVGLGARVARDRLLLIFAAVALSASAVSVTGGISFIGLMAPHIAKSLVGPRIRLALPLSMLIGGWLLLAADTVGRNLIDPDGIPAGIMVSLIGAPYFVYLLLRRS